MTTALTLYSALSLICALFTYAACCAARIADERAESMRRADHHGAADNFFSDRK